MTNILTIDELKNSVLNANIDDEYIQPAIDEAQSIYLREILGDALLNAIINKINGNNLTGKYLTLVNDYVKPYLSYMIQSIIVVPITYKIRNAGVIQQYDNGFTTTQMKDTQYLKDYYDGKAEFYGNRLTEWLRKNANDIVEYRLSASNVTNPTTSQNVTNIFLGGTKRGKCGCVSTSGGGGTHDTVDWNDITNRPDFATVATSGSYNDLSDKPEIPSLEGYATEQWVENQGYSTFSGDYNDLSNKPTIPTVNNATLTITQGGTTKGTFSANANENVTINLDAGGSGSTDWSDITNKPDFAAVATSGDYDDLSNKPDLSVYAETNNLATVATSGSYNDLSNKPDIPSLEGYATEQWVENQGYSDFSGDYNDLTNKPTFAQVATSGDYRDLNNKPDLAQVATSGDYRDLSNTPTIPTLVQADWSETDSTADDFIKNKPSLGAVATSNDYRDLNNKPDLAQVATSGDYRDLSNTPNFAAVATSGDYHDLTHTPTIVTPVNANWTETDPDELSYIVNKPDLAQVATSGDYHDLSNTPSLGAVATSNDYRDLDNKPTIPTVNNATLTITQGGTTKGMFTANAGTDVTINLDAGGSGSTDWSDITNKPNFAAVATSGSYNDLSNTPTIPTVNDGSLTIQKNGTTIATFTANDYTNTTANITVPTDETDLGLTTETWTFTLQDSSTVTKQVVIKPTV